LIALIINAHPASPLLLSSAKNFFIGQARLRTRLLVPAIIDVSLHKRATLTQLPMQMG